MCSGYNTLQCRYIIYQLPHFLLYIRPRYIYLNVRYRRNCLQFDYISFLTIWIQYFWIESWNGSPWYRGVPTAISFITITSAPLTGLSWLALETSQPQKHTTMKTQIRNRISSRFQFKDDKRLSHITNKCKNIMTFSVMANTNTKRGWLLFYKKTFANLLSTDKGVRLCLHTRHISINVSCIRFSCLFQKWTKSEDIFYFLCKSSISQRKWLHNFRTKFIC